MAHVRSKKDFFTAVYSDGRSNEEVAGHTFFAQNLRDGDFSNKDLSGTTFRNCDLRGAIFHNIRVDARTVIEGCLFDPPGWETILMSKITAAKEVQAAHQAKLAELEKGA